MPAENPLTRRLLLLLFLCLTALLSAGPLIGQAPATIYLIRHAEKLTDGREDLSWQGYERAAALPRLFLPVLFPAVTPSHLMLPKPDFLFATKQSKHSNRPYETIMPLSSALNLPISNETANDDYTQLAQLLLSGQYAGKVVLVSWHHGNLPQFAMALGAVPPYKWPETQFDRVWRIDYAGGKATLTDLPQGLLPGDSK